MTPLERARRVLSGLGRPAGHADGLYREHIDELAGQCDDAGNLRPGARSVWRQIHLSVLANGKATDDVTDEAEDS